MFRTHVLGHTARLLKVSDYEAELTSYLERRGLDIEAVIAQARSLIQIYNSLDGDGEEGYILRLTDGYLTWKNSMPWFAIYVTKLDLWDIAQTS